MKTFHGLYLHGSWIVVLALLHYCVVGGCLLGANYDIDTGPTPYEKTWGKVLRLLLLPMSHLPKWLANGDLGIALNSLLFGAGFYMTGVLFYRRMKGIFTPRQVTEGA